jgi:hypothetical protein
MRYARAGAALLVLLVCVSAAPGQFFLTSPHRHGGFSAAGFHLGLGRSTRHGHFGFSLSRGGGYYPLSYPCGPGYFGYPAFAPFPASTTFVQVYSPPVYSPPPIIVAPNGFRRGDDEPAPRREPPRQRIDDIDPRDFPPGEPAGGFRPIRPEERARIQQGQPAEPPAPPMPPAVPPAPKVPAAPPVPMEKPKAARAPELPRPAQPETDPQAESARLAALGREAFAAGEYGRAAERFRQASAAAPRDPEAQFLLAQTQVALGKYDEAVAAIHVGLRLRPDWPTTAFRPVELYGDSVADLPRHLEWLEEALRQHPNDPVLLFLYAYQLWFDGRRDEARLLFQRALPLTPDPSDCERFLLARPGEVR